MLADKSRQVSRRSPHNKSRNGCLRCKRRHVKCDEGRPQCQRCNRINVQCPGYNIPEPRIFGLGRDECFNSDFEKLCFQSFATSGTKRLLDLQPAAANFWQTIVLQLGDVYPAIRHITIAISLLQEPLVRTHVRDALANSVMNVRASALLHFNKSIRNFLTSHHELRVEAQLACCLLYHTFEAFMENLPACGKHVRAADFILKGHVRSVANGNVLPEPAIVEDFSPLIQQHILNASTYIDDFQSNNHDCGNRYEIFQEFQLRLPQSVSDISTTYDYLATLIKYAVGCHLEDFTDRELVQSLHGTLDEFGILLEQSCLRSTHQRRGDLHMSVFEAQHQAAVILANTKHFDEFRFDDFRPNFGRIVDACTALLPELASHDLHPQLPLGLIPPLFLTSTRCRDYNLRIEANRLLHSILRVEHNWTSCMATSIASKVIKLEQEFSMNGKNYARRIGLRDVKLLTDAAQICVTCVVCDVEGPNASIQLHIPYEPRTLLGGTIQLGNMQRRALWAAGYSGVQFFSPGIRCHCATPIELHSAHVEGYKA